MDADVSHLKWGRELRLLETEAAAFLAETGVAIVAQQYPKLVVEMTHRRTGRTLRFQFDGTDWDDAAPGLALLDTDDRELTIEAWPQGGWAIGTHPATGKPFLCLPGIREYHTHPSHLNDSWAARRARHTYSLGHIIERVRQRFQDSGG